MAANVDRTLIAERVTRPAEALNVELKNWIDPTTPQGKAKIVRRHSLCATAMAASW